MLDVKKVKEFWDSQAQNENLGQEAVTHRDHQQRLLEIHMASSLLSPGSRLLDVGCGNGYATAIFARKVAEILAVDYSEAMIERARREHQQLSNVRWEVQDALNLNVTAAYFDFAMTLRCLINLGSWQDQQRAILNIHRALRVGGIFIMGEGTQQGRASLNEARQKCGLPAMPPVAFNLDLDEEVLWPFVKEHFEIVEIRRLGLYDFVSRIVHPMLVSPADPQYDAKINEVGRRISEQLSGLDDMAREFIAVLRKR